LLNVLVIQMDLLAPSGMKTEKRNQVYRLLLLCLVEKLFDDFFILDN
jgi:hypothetical protein